MPVLNPLKLPDHGMRLIEASAGTGKTYTITNLYLRLLLEKHRSVRDILVVTFTEAATEELRERIRLRMREGLLSLQEGRSDEPFLTTLMEKLEDRAAAAEHLVNELTRIDEAAIFTIHGFCRRMLQENAFESGSAFEVEFITDDSELLTQVVEDFWRTRFYPHPELAALAAKEWKTPHDLRQRISPYINNPSLTILPVLSDNEQALRKAYRETFNTVRKSWQRDQAAISNLLENDKTLSTTKSDPLAYSDQQLKPALAALDTFLTNKEPEDFSLPAGFELFTQHNLDEKVTDSKKKKGIRGPQHSFFEHCQTLFNIQRDEIHALTIQAIMESRKQLKERKQRQSLLSFDDLLLNLAEALQGKSGLALAERIANRFPIALIDEFQDTDPNQYAIFKRIYADRNQCALFMIGDPKQAIYSFRGADIFTYMVAKDDTDPHHDRFTLDTNWRSSTNLVKSVNALFEACRAAPFIYAGHIDFHPVQAAGKADQDTLKINGETPIPLQAWFVDRTTDNVDQRGKKDPQTKTISKNTAKRILSKACAEQILDLLLQGAAGRALIGARPLAPHDITVLIRDRHEAEAIQDALQHRGIASVYYSRDSVFSSLEAADLRYLLIAVANPIDERALRTALCTELIGVTAAQLDAMMQNELKWEAQLEKFHTYHDLWLGRGFMAMFRHLLHDLDIPQRLLGQSRGERRLTNLLQLAELAQTASREYRGIENLLRWFEEQCAEPNGDSDEQQLRLENDEALVKIVTIHKAKGLEYPVVFLPFLWTSKPINGKKPIIFHDDSHERRLILDLEKRPEHLMIAEQERLAEELRLTYVALTRAKHLCYFSWGQFNGASQSSLAWLLHAQPETDNVNTLHNQIQALNDMELRSPLDGIAADIPDSFTVTAPPSITARRYSAQTPHRDMLVGRTPSREVHQTWHIASFTGLSRNRFEAAERPDYGSAREDTETNDATSDQSIFEFPRGARAGIFMHKLFEEIDFTNESPECLAQTVRTQLATYGYESKWQSVIEEMVNHVLDTPLDGETLSLRNIDCQHRLTEMEFHYAIQRVMPDRLNRLLPGLGGFESDSPKLQFQPVSGVMRGFIDLIFEHNDRFYIADYKSNFLGTQLESYRGPALDRAMAVHRYDVQYLIYTIALHRYLQRRLPNYSYENHFGGVYYLFLRGMHPNPLAGIWHDRPQVDLINDLDALFRGQGDNL